MDEDLLRAMLNRTMRPGLAGAPTPVGWVKGTSMDYHGSQDPIEAARPLSRREPGARGSLGEGVLVGVVDTGMRAHPWLDGGYLASPNDFEAFDVPWRSKVQAQHLAGHGTFVTGLILQQAPGAGVWVEQALDPSGAGLASKVAQAAETLAKRGVQVLNLSLGCFDDDPGARVVMERLVERLTHTNRDMVIVAAAGNVGSGQDGPKFSDFWPAALDGVVAVGAVDPPDASGTYSWSSWSNHGEWVNLAVPATDLLSTYIYGLADNGAGHGSKEFSGWATWSGTSMAAAVVSGSIAKLMGEGCTAQQAAHRLQTDTSLPLVAADGDAPAVRVVEPARWAQLSKDHHGR